MLLSKVAWRGVTTRHVTVQQCCESWCLARPVAALFQVLKFTYKLWFRLNHFNNASEEKPAYNLRKTRCWFKWPYLRDGCFADPAGALVQL